MTRLAPLFGSHAKVRPVKPWSRTRKTYAARLVTAGDERYLELRRGAWTKTIDATGDVVAADYDARAVPWANVGDRLFVFGADDAQIALVEIAAVDRDGWRYRIATQIEIESPGDGDVYVMRLDAAKGRR